MKKPKCPHKSVVLIFQRVAEANFLSELFYFQSSYVQKKLLGFHFKILNLIEFK